MLVSLPLADTTTKNYRRNFIKILAEHKYLWWGCESDVKFLPVEVNDASFFNWIMSFLFYWFYTRRRSIVWIRRLNVRSYLVAFLYLCIREKHLYICYLINKNLFFLLSWIEEKFPSTMNEILFFFFYLFLKLRKILILWKINFTKFISIIYLIIFNFLAIKFWM